MHIDIQVNLTYLFGLWLSLMTCGSVLLVSESNTGHTLVVHEKSPEKVTRAYIDLNPKRRLLEFTFIDIGGSTNTKQVNRGN